MVIFNSYVKLPEGSSMMQEYRTSSWLWIQLNNIQRVIEENSWAPSSSHFRLERVGDRKPSSNKIVDHQTGRSFKHRSKTHTVQPHSRSLAHPSRDRVAVHQILPVTVQVSIWIPLFWHLWLNIQTAIGSLWGFCLWLTFISEWSFDRIYVMVKTGLPSNA